MADGNHVEGKNIILYDGVCGLCNKFNKFVLANDVFDSFAFASLQSDFAGELLGRFGISREDLFTIYVVSDYGSKNSKVIKKADAVIFVARKMRAPLPFLATVFDAMPKVLTNLAYDLVAKNRYRFFGRYDTCLLPGSKDAEKFIEV